MLGILGMLKMLGVLEMLTLRMLMLQRGQREGQSVRRLRVVGHGEVKES